MMDCNVLRSANTNLICFLTPLWVPRSFRAKKKLENRRQLQTAAHLSLTFNWAKLWVNNCDHQHCRHSNLQKHMAFWKEGFSLSDFCSGWMHMRSKQRVQKHNFPGKVTCERYKNSTPQLPKNDRSPTSSTGSFQSLPRRKIPPSSLTWDVGVGAVDRWLRKGMRPRSVAGDLWSWKEGWEGNRVSKKKHPSCSYHR